MTAEHYLICKKQFKRKGIIIFEVNKVYKYYGEYYGEYYNQIFLYYNESSSSLHERGYTFYTENLTNKFNFLISDYFCNLQESRKIKLDKLNEKSRI